MNEVANNPKNFRYRNGLKRPYLENILENYIIKLIEKLPRLAAGEGVTFKFETMYRIEKASATMDLNKAGKYRSIGRVH